MLCTLSHSFTDLTIKCNWKIKPFVKPYWYVVSDKNLDEFLSRVEKDQGQVVFFAMSVPDYELMAYNTQELKRYINELKEVVI